MGVEVGASGGVGESVPSVSEPPAVSVWQRSLVSLGVALLVVLIPVWSLGLLGDGPVGMQDNGDGQRLYCGTGLSPQTPDGQSAWAGRVILDFRVAEPCADPMPSMSLALLRLSSIGGGSDYSLLRLMWLYLGVMALAAAWSAFLITRSSLPQVALLLPATAPLALPETAGFLVSTYAEPAGLLGGFLVLIGVPALLVARSGGGYTAGIALTLGGGLIAAASKVPYTPLLLVAIATCILAVWTRPGMSTRGKSMAVAVTLVALLAGLYALNDLTRWQQRQYGTVNVFNLVYTLVLVEVPGAAATLDLPERAADSAGVPAVLARPELAAGTVVQTEPSQTIRAATLTLAGHPLAAVEALGKGVQAAAGGELRYLLATPEGLREPATGPDLLGEQGASAGDLQAWLDSLTAPWRGSLVILVGLLVGLVGLRSRAPSFLTAVMRLAGIAAISGFALVVLGLADGYFELAKHVWLGGYFIDATTVALVLAGGVAAIRYLRTALVRAG